MKVEIEIMGPALKRLANNPETVEIPAGSRVADLMNGIGYSEKEARFMVYVRGEERLKLDSTLFDNDRIRAVLQVGGG